MARGDASSDKTTYTLEFDATQMEPQLENIFLSQGGSIGAAQARGLTDFAVTGSAQAQVHKLADEFCTRVRIPLPANAVSPCADDASKIVIDSRCKVLLCTSRGGVAINGTLVDSVSGQAAVYLHGLLSTAATGNAPIPLTYANWRAHSAVVTASGARIVDQSGRQPGIAFKTDAARDASTKNAETLISSYADSAWSLRSPPPELPGLRYPESEFLTKAICKVPTGINDSGFDFAHNVVMQKAPYSMKTIDAIFKNSISGELGFYEEKMKTFMNDTSAPGRRAADNAHIISNALSTAVNQLVSYRADGRTAISPTGAIAQAAESWLRQAPRSNGMQADDCDGTAISVMSLVRAVVNATPAERTAYPHVNAARNVIYPHYQCGVAVVGATSAEASKNVGNLNGSQPAAQVLAGHATAVMLPTMNLLRALDKGTKRARALADGTAAPTIDAKEAATLAEARLRSFYADDVIGQLPDAERGELLAWKTAQSALVGMPSFSCEGTTPAIARLYESPANENAYKEALKTNEQTTKAALKIGATVGRSIKSLHVGGQNVDSPHRFYHDFVEITFGRDTPLWSTSTADLGHAATQIVLTPDESVPDAVLSRAGVTPRALYEEAFSAVPLVSVNAQNKAIMDHASELADHNCMPSRGTVTRLTAFQDKNLGASMDALANLHDHFRESSEPVEGTDVANIVYVLSVNSLVNNPNSVAHFCNKVKKTASFCMVDCLDVPGLLLLPNDEEGGKQVTVDVVMKV